MRTAKQLTTVHNKAGLILIVDENGLTHITVIVWIKDECCTVCG